MDLLGCQLVLTCQRTDCDAQEVLDVSEWDLVERRIEEAAVGGEIQSGWGWDTDGLNLVFHCPEHRE